MKDFVIEDFDIHKNYVLEASAGTGKTYNIKLIVQKLVDSGVDINQILVVTYTEKAAGELRDRIKAQLKDPKVDNAPIYTINAFCLDSIKEFSLSSNLPFNLNMIDDSYLEDFIIRYVRSGDFFDEVKSFINSKDIDKFDEIKFVKSFKKGISSFYLDLDNQMVSDVISLGGYKELIQSFDNVNKYRSCKDLDEYLISDQKAKEYFDYLVKSASSFKLKKLEEFTNCIRNSFDPGFKLDKKFERNYSSKKVDIVEQYQYFYDLLVFDCEPYLLTKYLPDLYIKWQDEKSKNKMQTFSDQIRYVRECVLSGGLLKTKLKEKYRYAIIDEFQDTNQVSFDIFKSIFMDDDEHHIIVVGDPKQSIYSFQGTDVFVYFNAVKEIENSGGEVCRLNKNYRSTSDMVKACNGLFNSFDFNGTSFVDCDYLSIDKGDKVHEVKYCGKDIDALWIIEKDDENDKNIDSSDFSLIVAQRIIDCCSIDSVNSTDGDIRTKLRVKDKDSEEFRNVTFKDFAVLVRSGYDSYDLEKALKNSGIPYLKYKDKALFKGRECLELIILLNAVNCSDYTGNNRSLLLKALFTSFFGKSLKELRSDRYQTDDIKELALFNKWKQFKEECLWEDLFDSIINSSEITNVLKTLKEIQSLGIFKQLANYCIEYLSNGKSLEELVRNLSNLNSGNDSDDDGSIIERSTNFDCVQIMTIHASKGLQFPVVIAMYSDKVKNEAPYIYHDESNKKVISFYETNDIVNSCEDEIISENKRLYYVSYTRAQFIMMLPYNIKKDYFLDNSLKNYIDNKYPYQSIYDSKQTYPILRRVAGEILSMLDKNIDESKMENQNVVLKDLIKTTPYKKSYKHSYSGLSHGSMSIDEEENKNGDEYIGLSGFDSLGYSVLGNYIDKQLDIPTFYPSGAVIGTALHEVMENLEYPDFSNNIRYNVIRAFKNNGINTSNDVIIDISVLMIENIIEAKLPIINGGNKTGDYFTLNDFSNDQFLSEVEFNFNLLDERFRNYCNGFIDLIIKNGEYYSVLDWKSDKLRENFVSYSDPDNMKEHVDESYSIQRVLYSYCLIKWLKNYYPDSSYEDIYNNHFGGVYYVFFRGCIKGSTDGVYCHTWKSFSELEASFNEIINKKVGY